MPRRLRARGRGRRGRRGGRRGRLVHTLTYTCSFSMDKKSGDRTLDIKDFNIPTDRICRVRTISVQYQSQGNYGQVLSFTILSHSASADDATARSPALLLSQFPRRYTLRNPPSTDFAYLNSTSKLSVFTLSAAEATLPDNTFSYFLVTVVMQFQPMQPRIRDLGCLPPSSPRSGGGEDSPYSMIRSE